jgi:hypothetical protein
MATFALHVYNRASEARAFREINNECWGGIRYVIPFDWCGCRCAMRLWHYSRVGRYIV